MGDDFASWLVVRNHTCGRWVDADPDGLAIDLDLIAKLNALSNVGGLVVDRNPAFQNQLLHFQARAHTRLGQHLMQLGAFGHGCQNAFQNGFGHLLGFFFVKSTRDHIVKTNDGLLWKSNGLLG